MDTLLRMPQVAALGLHAMVFVAEENRPVSANLEPLLGR